MPACFSKETLSSNEGLVAVLRNAVRDPNFLRKAFGKISESIMSMVLVKLVPDKYIDLPQITLVLRQGGQEKELLWKQQ